MLLNAVRCDNRRVKKNDILDLNNLVAIKTFVCNEIDCFVIAFTQILWIFHSMSDYKVVSQRKMFHAMSSKQCPNSLVDDVTETRRNSTLTNLLCWLNSTDFERRFGFDVVTSNRLWKKTLIDWRISWVRRFALFCIKNSYDLSITALDRSSIGKVRSK